MREEARRGVQIGGGGLDNPKVAIHMIRCFRMTLDKTTFTDNMVQSGMV